jgi:hypothetical protein
MHAERLNDERNKMARGGDEMRRKSEASDEIWKRGYNLKPTKERSGESRGIAVRYKQKITSVVLQAIKKRL